MNQKYHDNSCKIVLAIFAIAFGIALAWLIAKGVDARMPV